MDTLIANLSSHRTELRELLVVQLGLPDATDADAFIDHQLSELIGQLRSIHVRLVFLVTTQAELKRQVLGGWGVEQFHYNRVADKILFDGEVTAALDGTIKESLIPAIYKSDDPPGKRADDLTAAVARTESGVAEMIPNQGQTLIESTLGEFALRKGLLPLKLQNNQDWFVAGVVGVVAAAGLSAINGQSDTDLIAKLTRFSRLNPVPPDAIDLLHPTPREQLRPQLVEAYADTYRRRSVKVVADWLATAGPDGLSKTMAAIRTEKPADNAALLAIIRKQTGVDLTQKLSATP